ncbi:programmed cell death 1 ligand 1-like [Astatotilapia calliptera]|uniref:programmed cell death 1 ligand 1-like n=1 Tax=Astatotilapia calliptera TaxID=8154 RepID=UPI000E404F1A|nr:programmed cell death 1 ligand 1-like [Astatotilapia calliptera]
MEKMICRILLLIILTSCVSGSFVVNVTQTCYQAEENHNITLEWTFTTKPDSFITSLKIRCSRPELSVLYQVHEGVEVSESQDAKFSGRVQSDKDALREGRIRLQLSGLRTEDSGLYRCEVKTNSGSSFQDCKLSVTGKLIE